MFLLHQSLQILHYLALSRTHTITIVYLFFYSVHEQINNSLSGMLLVIQKHLDTFTKLNLVSQVRWCQKVHVRACHA